MISFVDTELAEQTKLLGTEVGVSDWIKVDQSMIDQFADVTKDPQFIHTDPERAKAETPFGGTIAHGFLTLSLASRFMMDTFEDVSGQSMSINYGFDKLRFLNPVKCNSLVRARFTLRDMVKKSETQLLKTMDMTIEIQNETKPALVATWLWLMMFETKGN